MLKFSSLKPRTKKPVISTNKINPPALVHILHKPNFLFALSKKSVGGKTKGKITVKIVNDIVGAEI